MAVSAAISGLEGPDLPPIQEIQAAKERYDALSGLQKGFVSNSALLNQKYEERKTEDCTKKANQIASTIRAGGIGCTATYENDVLRIVEDFNVNYSLVMLNASTIVGSNIASASGTAKRGFEEMGVSRSVCNHRGPHFRRRDLHCKGRNTHFITRPVRLSPHGFLYLRAYFKTVIPRKFYIQNNQMWRSFF